jgi:prophage DNA circulation protein
MISDYETLNLPTSQSIIIYLNSLKLALNNIQNSTDETQNINHGGINITANRGNFSANFSTKIQNSSDKLSAIISRMEAQELEKKQRNLETLTSTANSIFEVFTGDESSSTAIKDVATQVFDLITNNQELLDLSELLTHNEEEYYRQNRITDPVANDRNSIQRLQNLDLNSFENLSGAQKFSNLGRMLFDLGRLCKSVEILSQFGPELVSNIDLTLLNRPLNSLKR